MQRKLFHRLDVLAIVFAVAGLTGCGNRDSASPEDGNSTAATQPSRPATSAIDASATAGIPATAETPPSAAMQVERYDDPKQAVHEFLTALRAGDQHRATSMLTVRAQQEMDRHDAAIQPPGSPTATFRVTQIAYVGEDRHGAQVTSVWEDAYPDGTKETHTIVWILRNEPSGWAVAGFATKVFPDQPMLVLNFEDPRDLQEKRAAVDDEIARRQTPAYPERAILE